MQQCLTVLVIIVANLSIVDVCGDSGYISGNSAKWTKCDRKKLQRVKSATGEECKTKTAWLFKVQHEIEQFIKRVQHEKKWNMKTLLHKKVQHGNGAVWKKCDMKRVQHEKHVTWRSMNCYSEVRKKCTRILHFRAQTDNGPSVDRPLCTGDIMSPWSRWRCFSY